MLDRLEFFCPRGWEKLERCEFYHWSIVKSGYFVSLRLNAFSVGCVAIGGSFKSLDNFYDRFFLKWSYFFFGGLRDRVFLMVGFFPSLLRINSREKIRREKKSRFSKIFSLKRACGYCISDFTTCVSNVFSFCGRNFLCFIFKARRILKALKPESDYFKAHNCKWVFRF